MEDAEIEMKIGEWTDGIDGIDFDIRLMLRNAIRFGMERTKKRAIACVPREKETVNYGEIARSRRRGFNECREQTLSALNEL